jgi:hypothetical protein
MLNRDKPRNKGSNLFIRSRLYLNLLTQRLYNCYNSLVNLKLYHNPSRIRSLNKFSLKKLIDKVF